MSFDWNIDKDVLTVVREGTLGRSPKASQNALLWPKSSQIALRGGQTGTAVPDSPSEEGNLGRPPELSKEGKGGGNFCHVSTWSKEGEGGGGNSAGKLDLSRVDLDFFAELSPLFVFAACGLSLFCRHFRLV